jgi:hypothetical protein
MERKIGGIIAVCVFAVVGVFLFLNLRRPEPPSVAPSLAAPPPAAGTSGGLSGSAPFREYPIGEVERPKEGLQIVAVWLPPVQMEGMDLPQDADVIHLEADIHALEGNVNGFGRGAWVPYLSLRYEIIPADANKESISGPFMPMVAKDGPHYGATIRMPGRGKYRLKYLVKPPGMETEFGRHSDPVTGVAPWWEPFGVEFEFDYPGGEAPSKPADSGQ